MWDATRGDDAFERAERELLELAGALDEPVRHEEFALAVVGLGQRSRSLFIACRAVRLGAAPVAVRVLLRTMVEINLLIRFLEKSPELHAELWLAEGDRNALTVARELTNNEHLAWRWAAFVEPGDVADVPQRQAAVDQARAKAKAAGLPGVRNSGQVLPSIGEQLKTIAEPAADEAYTLVYRSLSWDAHGGARSLLARGVYETNGGELAFRDDSTTAELRASRALAITTFASTLKLCDVHLDLGIGAAADEILRWLVPQSPARPTRPISNL